MVSNNPHTNNIGLKKRADFKGKNKLFLNQDTLWAMSLYGTAIGAGVLFLPINAGLGGGWTLLAMFLLAFPMTYYAHQNLCRFVLSGTHKQKDVIDVSEEHFGYGASRVIAVLYFLAIWPIVLMYSVALTNTVESFIINQLHGVAPSRAFLSLVLIASIMLIVRLGQSFIVKVMSTLVAPFIVVLIVLSVMLIPHWSTDVFSAFSINQLSHFKSSDFSKLWLILPVIVFSFNHSPIISSFAMAQKDTYGRSADKKSTEILRKSHFFMILTVMFFVLSCVLSVSASNLLEAKQQNVSILSYLANHFHNHFFSYVAPLVAFIAIIKSFLGHYLGATEGLHALISKSNNTIKAHHSKVIKNFILLFMFCSCWGVAWFNPGILNMIEMLGGPIIALYLFLLPIYAIYTVPSMKKYCGRISNIFIFLIGVLTFFAVLYACFS